MTASAAILITGNEIASGRVADANGPWLSSRLHQLGFNVSYIICCNDRMDELERCLSFLVEQGVGLIVTSGGLGPTADDITMEAVSRFFGAKLERDKAVVEAIESNLGRFARRWRVDEGALKAAATKQSLVPKGAGVLMPAGTAPGAVLNASGCLIIVLPGPPSELQIMWQAVLSSDGFKEALGQTEMRMQRTLRFISIPESDFAKTQRELGDSLDLSKLEITTCMRRAELEVVIRCLAKEQDLVEKLVYELASRHGERLYSADGRTVDEIVAGLLQGRTIATAESCTAGLMAARLTDIPGASEYFIGSVVAYSNQAKIALLGVDGALIERFGAVSVEVSDAMAAGACEKFGAEIGVGITGIAGPGGATESKPAGHVCISLISAGAEPYSREVDLPGNRAEVRDRTTTVAMHILRRAIS